jgi:hypothetical protein
MRVPAHERPCTESLRRPTEWGCVRGLVLATFALVATPTTAVASPEPAVSAAGAAKSRDLFRKAAREYQQGNSRGAYEDYLAAWALQKSYDIAGNLANVEIELARYCEAADHASYALEHLPPTATARQRGFLETVLAEAKKHIATLTIVVNVDGAAITIDGKAVGTAPFPGEVFVEPGAHALSATVPDVGTGQQTVYAESGRTYAVALTVRAPLPVPKDLPPVAPPLPPPPPPRSPSGPSSLVVGGLFVGGVGLVAGAALAVGAAVVGGSADTTRANLLAQGVARCAGSPLPSGCATLLDQSSQRDTLANASVVAFVGGTAVAAGTLVYFFVTKDAPSKADTAGLWISPALGPSVAGVVVRDRF